MTSMVIRFSSVGDIVLCGAVTEALAPVIFVTKPEYRTLAAALPGVSQVLCPPQDNLPRQVEKIIDLHSNWRSFQIRKKVRAPVYSVQRHDLKRRLRVWLKVGHPPPSVISRYAKAAGIDRVNPTWGEKKTGSNNALALIPFCRHPTKEWPLAKYADLGKMYDGPVIILGGPQERKRMVPLLDAIGPKATALTATGFDEIIQAMGEIKVAVGGDTGLAHLCFAFQKPVITLMGPTTHDDGFWGHNPNTLSVDLPCRPCSRYGSQSCPIGDHLCMKSISVEEVWQKLEVTTA